MTGVQIIGVALLGLHVVIAGYVIARIIRTPIFSKTQKRLNIILTLTLPFIWSVLIYFLLKNEPSSYKVPVKNNRSSNGFHESGIGIDQFNSLQ